MKVNYKKSKKQLLATYTKRAGYFASVIAFSLFIALSPLLIDFGPNPTGIYLQKANAELCYDTTVAAGRENECRDTDQNLDANKCYRWENGDRQGNGRGYAETPCPVPASFDPERAAVCTNNSGDKIDCPSSANRGKCYTLGGRQGNTLTERVCTVNDVPSYNPFSTANTQSRQNQQAKDPECYRNSEKVECPDSIKNNAATKGKCYQQTRDNGPYDEVTCSTIQEATAAAAADNSQSCEERAALSSGWIVCGILELLSNGMDSMVGIIDSLLNVDATKIGQDAELQTIWSYFRAIATFSLVAIALVMIISQAIGGGN